MVEVVGSCGGDSCDGDSDGDSVIGSECFPLWVGGVSYLDRGKIKMVVYQ